jgi:hypothetical protein
MLDPAELVVAENHGVAERNRATARTALTGALRALEAGSAA